MKDQISQEDFAVLDHFKKIVIPHWHGHTARATLQPSASPYKEAQRREESSVALGLLAAAGQLAKESRDRQSFLTRRCLLIEVAFNLKLPEI